MLAVELRDHTIPGLAVERPVKEVVSLRDGVFVDVGCVGKAHYKVPLWMGIRRRGVELWSSYRRPRVVMKPL